jgi:hypothetical protein
MKNRWKRAVSVFWIEDADYAALTGESLAPVDRAWLLGLPDGWC